MTDWLDGSDLIGEMVSSNKFGNSYCTGDWLFILICGVTYAGWLILTFDLLFNNLLVRGLFCIFKFSNLFCWFIPSSCNTDVFKPIGTIVLFTLFFSFNERLFK